MTRGLFAVGLALMVGPPVLTGQEPATLNGNVIDQMTGRGIANAELTLGDDRRMAGEDGGFRLASAEPGTYRLQVRAIGYAAEIRDLVILPGQAITLTIALAPIPHRMDSLTVSADREPAIRGDQLTARGGDLPTALNGWEGIAVIRTGQGNEAIAQIRGSAPDEVLVLVDGFALNDPFTGRADLSRVPVQDIENVTLLRGVQSARAGNRAIAGVIEINTRRLHSSQVTVGAGTQETRRARVAAGAGLGTIALSMEVLPRDYGVEVPSGEEIRRDNAGGELWSLNARGRIGADFTVRGSLSDRGLPGTTVNPTPAAQARDRSLLLGLRTGERTWVSTSLQWLDTRAADPAPPPGFVEYTAHTWGFGGTAELGHRGTIRLGRWAGDYSWRVDGRHDRFDGDAVRADATFTRAGSSFTASLGRGSPLGWWTIAPAIRLDWFTGRSRPLGSGRMDVHLSLSRTRFRASLGSGVTVPALADLLFRDGVGVSLNPDLRPERVRWEAELEVAREFSTMGMDGSVRVSGYYGVVDDMILWTPNFRFIWSPGNFGVRRRGGEATLELHPATDLTMSGGAVLSSVTYDTRGGSQVPYRPRSSLSLQGSWSPGPWRLNLGWNYLGTRFSRNRETNPLPTFHLLRAGVERQLGRWSLRGEVRDLTDSRPVFIAGFPSPGRSVHLSLTVELP